MAEKWIQDTHMKKGALKEKLGVPESKKIPAKKMQKALHSKNPTIKKEAVLAKTLKSFHHKKSGGRGR